MSRAYVNKLNLLIQISRRILWCFLLIAGCERHQNSDVITTDSGLNTVDPHWVKRDQPRHRVAIVFVHGLFGSTDSSWNNRDGTGFFKFLREAKGIGERVDIFAFGFTSNMFSSGSLDIREAANKLEESLKFNGVWDYENVVFVAHSMGGLVTLRELIAHPERRERVPLIVLYATPARGSDITNIGKLVVKNPAVAQMIPADGNALLQQLSDDWGLISSNNKPAVICAYETASRYTQTIVSWSSAVAFCNGAPTAIGGANHIDIVKPNRAMHDSVMVLINALNEYVLGKDDQAFLETPDFSNENGKWVLRLTDPNGKTPARLVNRGHLEQTYTISGVYDPKLIVLPDPTPRKIPAHNQEELKILLQRGGDLKDEYEFTLSTPAMGPRIVTVKLVDKEAIAAAQAEVAGAMALQLEKYLSSPETAQWLQAANDEQRVDAIVSAAKLGVSNKVEGLSLNAEWILTADALNSAGFSNYAKKALNNVNIDPAKSVNAHAIKQLDNSIQWRSNLHLMKTDDKLKSNNVPFLKVASTENIINDDNTEAWRGLSEKMQRMPVFKAEGLSLKGDVLRSQGENEKALDAYYQANKVKPATVGLQIMEKAVMEALESQNNKNR